MVIFANAPIGREDERPENEFEIYHQFVLSMDVFGSNLKHLVVIRLFAIVLVTPLKSC